MINTVLRLAILVLAAILLVPIGVLGLGFAGLSIESVALAALLIGTPLALIGRTLADHRRRVRSKDGFNV